MGETPNKTTRKTARTNKTRRGKSGAGTKRSPRTGPSVKKGRSKTVAEARPTRRSAKRTPQGKRLGAWKKVKQADVFRYLEKSGTTISTLARTLGVGVSAVHAWKAGRRFPSEQAQLKLRQILKGERPATASKAPTQAVVRKPQVFNGKALRSAREARGLSRDRLSKSLKVSAGSIRNWEAGVSQPRARNLSKVEGFLGQVLAVPEGSTTIAGGGSTRESAVIGAAQVASAYLAAGHAMSPGEVVGFVAALRECLA